MVHECAREYLPVPPLHPTSCTCLSTHCIKVVSRAALPDTSLIEKVLGRLNHCNGDEVRSLLRGCDGWFSRFKKAGRRIGGGRFHFPDPSGEMVARGSDSKPTVISLIDD